MCVRQCALKCADLGHLALPNALHCKWVGRILEEFYRQGDLERSSGLTVSVLMNRNHTDPVASSQVRVL